MVFFHQLSQEVLLCSYISRGILVHHHDGEGILPEAGLSLGRVLRWFCS